MKEEIIDKTGAFIGFSNIGDFWSSMLGVKSLKLNFVLSITSGSLGFYQNYLYDDWRAIYTLWILMILDWFTGLAYARKERIYLSRLNFRMPIYIFVTSVILFLSHNIALANVAYTPLPGILYGGFVGVYLSSLLENVGKLNILPPKASEFLAKHAGLKSIKDHLEKKKINEDTH